jgi:hypothetical protein
VRGPSRSVSQFPYGLKPSHTPGAVPLIAICADLLPRLSRAWGSMVHPMGSQQEACEA